MNTKITPAGRKMIAKYLQAERNDRENLIGERLCKVVHKDGSVAFGLRLSEGDNSVKVCAEKLARQGYGLTIWSPITRTRAFFLNDEGRKAFTED